MRSRWRRVKPTWYSVCNEHKVTIESVGNIYPNPVTSNSRMEVSLKEPATVEFDIYNQVGQLVLTYGDNLSAGTHSVAVNTSQLKPGLYLLRITTAQGDQVTRRFVK